ncbi:hypothetical protein [Vibrio cincinnatiensis]|jgi:hypothetical protein|uniref:Transposase n=1 Tax=Vibrio cincinnatiensis DSM 19608 TaxID=1123491 RepID=A0A1T4LI49_VIBCI|nr:hypothetical protein [Vibrio cincinnatiensis]MCG3723003.1 hypothetical protein [Vibrio cincinnatiensis]SJZ54291.1 hypothetical protein SAMN02745782_00593 [Vibrio cincinnatiensis DSM 19608]SUP05974.1 Uncharacterised protein [Vibrio cincinnatiensis]
MSRYSLERKEAILKKLQPPYSRSVVKVAKEKALAKTTALLMLRKISEPFTGKNPRTINLNR